MGCCYSKKKIKYSSVNGNVKSGKQKKKRKREVDDVEEKSFDGYREKILQCVLTLKTMFGIFLLSKQPILEVHVLKYGYGWKIGPRTFDNEFSSSAIPKQCFNNCARAISKAPRKYTYCEGIVFLREFGIPIEHGWLVDNQTGEVIDPTLKDDSVDVYLGIPVDTTYYTKHIDNTNTGDMFSPMYNREIYTVDVSEYLAEKKICLLGYDFRQDN